MLPCRLLMSPAISRIPRQPAMWLSVIQTRWFQELNFLAFLSELCFLTMEENAVWLIKSLTSWAHNGRLLFGDWFIFFSTASLVAGIPELNLHFCFLFSSLFCFREALNKARFGFTHSSVVSAPQAQRLRLFGENV